MRGKEITIPATSKPFSSHEAHLDEAPLFTEMATQERTPATRGGATWDRRG